MLEVGTVLRISHRDKITKEKTVQKWIVKESYPHMVLCEDANGIRRCFSHGDLIVMRKIKQSPELEALRKSVNAEHRFTGKYIKQ